MKLEDHTSEQLYDDETQLGLVDIDIEALWNRHERNEDFLHALERVEDAAKRELQVIQDELDETGEVGEA